MNKFILIFSFFIFVSSAYAHLDSGEDKTIGDYLVDLRFSPEAPRSLENVDVVINLVNSTTEEAIKPDKAWLRISDSNTILFTGTLNTESGNVVFSYTFPKEGDYEIFVKFFNNNILLVETTFNITILDKIKTLDGILPISLIAIIIILLVFIKKKVI